MDRDVAVGVQVDVSDEAAVQAMVDATVLAFGGVDLVVNNAGLSLSKTLLETTVADWDLQHDVMAKGSFLVSRAAAKVLIEQRLGGDIVYISSKNSVFAGPNNIAYSAVKADQAHQVRLLAAELGEHGIKVNGVNPDGVVAGSGIFAGGWGAKRAAVYGVEEKDLGKFYAQRTLLKQEVLPEHCAQAVFVLCSPELSRTTGLHIPVDSGVAAAFLQMSQSRPGSLRGRRPGRLQRPGDGRRGRSRHPAARRPPPASPTSPVRTDDGLHWDVVALVEHAIGRPRDGVRRGAAHLDRRRLLGGRLRAAARRPAARAAVPLPRRAAHRARVRPPSTP